MEKKNICLQCSLCEGDDSDRTAELETPVAESPVSFFGYVCMVAVGRSSKATVREVTALAKRFKGAAETKAHGVELLLVIYVKKLKPRPDKEWPRHPNVAAINITASAQKVRPPPAKSQSQARAWILSIASSQTRPWQLRGGRINRSSTPSAPRQLRLHVGWYVCKARSSSTYIQVGAAQRPR